MKPWLEDPDVTIHHGDAISTLREMPAESVHMCVTSPPFYGLRDYGVDGQIGLEETPEEWCANLVDVFREVKRVLRDDGTLWVEVGSTYAARTMASDEWVLRDDITADERAYVYAELAKQAAVSDVRPADAPAEQDVQEVPSCSSSTAAELQGHGDRC